jgi:putative FmdB family regulatory protein
MPIYEYQCKKCKKEFECLVLGSEGNIVCPECNGKDVQRLMSACRFKSSGEGEIPSASRSSACATCAGGSCSTCH